MRSRMMTRMSLLQMHRQLRFIGRCALMADTSTRSASADRSAILSATAEVIIGTHFNFISVSRNVGLATVSLVQYRSQEQKKRFIALYRGTLL